MSGPALFLLFVAILIVAARLCLRGDRRPPIRPDKDRVARVRDQDRSKG